MISSRRIAEDVASQIDEGKVFDRSVVVSSAWRPVEAWLSYTDCTSLILTIDIDGLEGADVRANIDRGN
jgi:hypothetical protein